mmetsp:Transcript_31629/g.48376  ORF Transcript_31629/g.48376 Transcript_31629/m.48376 type:complete len:135 (-) Transcript_31629:11-415(-)
MKTVTESTKRNHLEGESIQKFNTSKDGTVQRLNTNGWYTNEQEDLAIPEVEGDSSKSSLPEFAESGSQPSLGAIMNEENSIKEVNASNAISENRAVISKLRVVDRLLSLVSGLTWIMIVATGIVIYLVIQRYLP